MTTSNPVPLTPANAKPQDAGTLEGLLDKIRSEAGVTDEDLAFLERTTRVIIDNKPWEVGQPVPVRGSQVVVYIADDGDEVRIYSVPGKGQNEMGMRWRRSPLRSSQSLLSMELFESFIGREMTDAIEGATEAPELEEVLDYLRGLPGQTPVAQAVADIEAGKHQIDSEGDDPPKTS